TSGSSRWWSPRMCPAGARSSTRSCEGSHKGAGRPRPSSLLSPVADIHEMTGYRRRGGHGRGNEMRATLEALPALEVAVRGGSAALAGLQPVVIHGQAHGATRLAPVEAGFDEDPVQSFRLGLSLHKA